jgi:AcrR family transcriptional regulator
MPEPSVPPPSSLRTDAERNRCRILAAAGQVFADHGLEVSMNAIAKRAGVGIATLYRRFPTREALITEVFGDRMEAYARAVDVALADPDPWRGFSHYVEQVCAMQAADRGFGDVLTRSFPTAKAFEATRAQAYEGFDELVVRAQATGKLRPDFTHQDLVLVLMANAGVIAATGDAAPDAWRRVLAYLLDAFAVTPEPTPLPAAPTPTALYRAMVRLNRGHEATAEAPR